MLEFGQYGYAGHGFVQLTNARVKMTKAEGDTQASPSGEETPMTAIFVALIVALERSGTIRDGMHRLGAQMDWWLAALKSPQPCFRQSGSGRKRNAAEVERLGYLRTKTCAGMENQHRV